MEAPVSASLGVVRSLPAKLERLLSPEADDDDGLRLREREKSKIRLLKDLIQELIDKYLMEPRPEEVEAPAATARCWMKEVRELSYDIDDFIHEIIHADPKKHHVKIPWLRKVVQTNESRRSRWIAGQGSQLRARLRDAIRRYNNYNLDRSKMLMLTSSIASEEPPPRPPLFDLATAPLVGIDGPMKKLQEWLVGDGVRNLRSVSIVGFGGVGKTTLAKELYSKMESKFECRAFVRTSHKPDVRKLLSSILLQVRPADALDSTSNLTDTIRAHLQHKKYFIIIDDLWASSTWDIVCRALPNNECCSRVLITTEIDVVAQRCCGHTSEYILKMGPLRQDEARTLFFSRFPGDQSGSTDQSDVLFDIVRKCGGFPLATVTISSLLARQHSLIEQCNYIRRSLSSNLRTNPSMEGMKQLLSHCYDCLPGRLKACMLYVSIYKEDHIIWKEDLVKQWIAEGFICAEEGKNLEEVASAYFDELVSRGLIQPEDINYSGEVLSCTVHYMILNLIKCKSVEENFVTAIDCSQTNIRLADKVRRLSLLFGDADDAEQPANLRLSNVRSLVFDGRFKILPSIGEFQHLRVLILHIWGDQDNISFDLSTLRRLSGLKYLQMVCDVNLNLQTGMQGLKYLETLKIDSRVMKVPKDIVNLPRLLHLSLPGGTNLPDGIERLATLRTFGCFDLTRNSAEIVWRLCKLTNIWDLRLTCSEQAEPYSLKKKMDQLSSVITNLRNLKYLTLLGSGSFKEITLEASTGSSTSICFDLSRVSSPPILLEKLELMPRICMLFVLPKWIRELRLLSILKIEVVRLLLGDIDDILEGLPALTDLSLYVKTTPSRRVTFRKDGFPVLKHLMFICPSLCVAFNKGAMPSVRRMKLGFNANTIGECSIVGAGLENLAVLEVLSAQIGGPAGAYKFSRQDVHHAWDETFRWSRNRKPPILNVELADRRFYSDKEIHTDTASATRQTIDDAVTTEDVISSPVTDMSHEDNFSDRYSCVLSPTPSDEPDVPLKDKDMGMDIFSVTLDMHNKQTKKKLTSAWRLPWRTSRLKRRSRELRGSSEADHETTEAARRHQHPSKKSLKMPPTIFFDEEMPPTIESSISKWPSRVVEHFTLDTLHVATDGFSGERLIGEGWAWSVYRGTLPDGHEVAVKRARATSWPSGQHNPVETAFNMELKALACTNHVNIVSLIGYCTESGQRMLVQEFMTNGTLQEQLDGRRPMVQALSSWRSRLTIALDVARGIEYLHVYAVPPIIHGDVKPSNIMLDKVWTAKITGFDLSSFVDLYQVSGRKVDPQDPHYGVGTLGYMDPEYYVAPYRTDKSDVYSFGIVLLELLTGCRADQVWHDGKTMNMVQFIVPHIEAGNITHVLDRRLPTPMPIEAEKLAYVGYLATECVRPSREQRPSMAKVTATLNDALINCMSVPLSRAATGRRSTLSCSSSNDLLFNLTDVDEMVFVDTKKMVIR